MPVHIEPLHWFLLLTCFIGLFFAWMFYIARNGREISVSFSGLGANLNVSSKDEDTDAESRERPNAPVNSKGLSNDVY